MSREILYHAAIQNEIREILDHYGDISEQLADDFRDELTAALEHARRVFPNAITLIQVGVAEATLKGSRTISYSGPMTRKSR